MMESSCDTCGELFVPKFKEKKHSQQVVETYFVCPHCKKRYVCSVTDLQVRKWQRLIKKEKLVQQRVLLFDAVKRQMASLKEKIVKRYEAKG